MNTDKKNENEKTYSYYEMLKEFFPNLNHLDDLSSTINSPNENPFSLARNGHRSLQTLESETVSGL